MYDTAVYEPVTLKHNTLAYSYMPHDKKLVSVAHYANKLLNKDFFHVKLMLGQ